MAKLFTYLLTVLLYVGIVSGCRTTRPAPPSEVLADGITVATPGQPAKRVAHLPTKVGKKSTVNYYLAPAQVATAGKKSTATVGDANKVASGQNKGNLALADSSAQVIDQAKAKQAAANTGAGSRSDQLNTAPPAPPWYSYLLSPVGKAIGVVIILILILLWLRRRSQSNA